MAKTIRSHPTFHILVLEPICWTTLQNMTPKWTYLFFIFRPPHKQKDRPPKEKRCAWTIPSYQVFVKISLFILYLLSFFNFLGKTHFLQLLSYFNSFVHLRFQYGRPQIIVISKQNSYFKIRTCVGGAFLAGTFFLSFLRILAQQM